MSTKINANKLLVSILLIAVLCAPMISMTLAAPDDDSQTLISPAPEDEPASTADGNPVLIQQRDTDTNATDSSTTPTEGQFDDETNLIATNTSSDNTALVAAILALATAIALGASITMIRRRKK